MEKVGILCRKAVYSNPP